MAAAVLAVSIRAGSRDWVEPVPPVRSDKDADVKPGEPVYVVLDSARMVVDGRAQALSPGMAVTAEVKTGRRRVISYLLSPLRRYAHEGIRER